MRAIFIALLLSLSAAHSADPEADIQVSRDARELNELSKRTLGLDLRSLALLLETDGESYVPDFALEENGKQEALDELVAAGYVTTEKVSELPDGTRPDGELTVIRPTSRRDAIVRGLWGLE